jgi:hypothetical protein
MVIAATRMHRSLVDYATGSSDLYDSLAPSFLSPAHFHRCIFSANESFRDSGITNVQAKGAFTTPIPLDRMDFTVHMASEPHSARQIRDRDSCASSSQETGRLGR